MNLYDKLQLDMKQSLKDKQLEKLSVLRMLIAEIRNQRIDKGEIALNDESVLAIIKRQIKQHEDSAMHYNNAGRAESAEKEKKEIEVLKEYISV